MHDPTRLNRQGPDIGDSYRSAVFCFSDEQKTVAERAKAAAQANFNKRIVTEITPAAPFYDAEDYHQKFTERTGRGMCHIPYKSLS